MDLTTCSFSDDAGWSQPLPSDLDSENTIVLAFGASDLARISAGISDLTEAFPRSCILGCSTAGEILQTNLLDGSLVVAVGRMETTRLAECLVSIDDSNDSFAAGQRLAQQLDAADLKGVLLFSEGLTVNGSELVRGVNSVLDDAVTVTGGLAGDGDRFRKTWVLGRHATHRHSIAAVGFYGNALRFGYGSKGGWDPFGVERRVTRSAGNVLYELDGRPALALYKEYLGDRAAGLPATGLLFPLSLRADTNDTESLVRTILSVNEADQSITFAGDVPEGSLATLMHANLERLIDGATDAAEMTGASGEPGPPTLAIAVSCVGRRLVLGERSEEEIEATLDVLSPHTQQVGFYSYGEISPQASGQCDLHNQTMTLTTITEVDSRA